MEEVIKLKKGIPFWPGYRDKPKTEILRYLNNVALGGDTYGYIVDGYASIPWLVSADHSVLGCTLLYEEDNPTEIIWVRTADLALPEMDKHLFKLLEDFPPEISI